MIVIFRHGFAENNFESDFHRNLTDQGIADITKRAEYLKNSGINFDITFVSPYIRTLQTLDIIQNFVSVGEVSITHDLEPNAQPNIADYFRVLDDQKKNILVISHMPLVGFIIKELGGDFANGFMSPGDMTIFGEKGTNEIYKVIYTTNVIDYNL